MKLPIPVFFHVPKSSGTYLYNCILSEIRKINKTVHVIRVIDGQHMLAKIVINSDLSFFGDKLTPINNTNVARNLNFLDLTEDLLKRLSVIFVSVEARGFRRLNDSLKALFLVLSKSVLHKFIILREPFSREQSLYNYLTSEKSNHELTHNLFNSPSFEEHVMSKQLQDSWIIRVLLDLPVGTTLTEEHFNKACEILETMETYDINQTNKAIQDVLSKCFNVNNFDSNTVISPKMNKNTYNKIEFNELTLDAQTRFNNHKYLDQQLYNRFVSEKPTH
jgi:hypothetical protein